MEKEAEDYLDALVKEREKIQDRLDDINSEIAAMCDQCQKCKNWHYPHC